jgi:hypothetical protein
MDTSTDFSELSPNLKISSYLGKKKTFKVMSVFQFPGLFFILLLFKNELRDEHDATISQTHYVVWKLVTDFETNILKCAKLAAPLDASAKKILWKFQRPVPHHVVYFRRSQAKLVNVLSVFSSQFDWKNKFSGLKVPVPET